MQVRRPKGVLGERVAFVSRTAQVSAAACFNRTWLKHIENAESEFCTFEFVIRKFCLFVCLFICAELIEELAKTTDLKFGMRVEDVVATNKF